MKYLMPGLTAILLAFATVPVVSASAIHKWVDEKGVTHYSDEAPSIEATQVTQVELRAAPITERKIDENYYSIANQWARLQQERLEREKERLEREKLRLLAEQAKASKKPAVTNVYVEKKQTKKKRYARVDRKHYYKKHYRKAKKQAVNPGYTYRFYQSKYPPGLHPGRNANTDYKTY